MSGPASRRSPRASVLPRRSFSGKSSPPNAGSSAKRCAVQDPSPSAKRLSPHHGGRPHGRPVRPGPCPWVSARRVASHGRHTPRPAHARAARCRAHQVPAGGATCRVTNLTQVLTIHPVKASSARAGSILIVKGRETLHPDRTACALARVDDLHARAHARSNEILLDIKSAAGPGITLSTPSGRSRTRSTAA